MKIFLLGFCFLGGGFITTAQTNYSLATSHTTAYPLIKNGFANVPDQSRLRCYWWWLNSMATKASITRDLEQMKLNGYGGASIVDAGSSNYTVAAKTKAGPANLLLSKPYFFALSYRKLTALLQSCRIDGKTACVAKR